MSTKQSQMVAGKSFYAEGYNPEDSECGPNDFLDGMHQKEICVNTALRETSQLNRRQ